MVPSHDRKHLPQIVVLVVDDSPIDRALAQRVLERQLRAVVHVADNGAAALESIEEAAPDVILTDLQMPEVDGLGLVEAIRRDHPFIPTILMTAHGSEEIAFAALRAGAASYVNKRNLAHRLAETVQDVLAISHGARPTPTHSTVSPVRVSTFPWSTPTLWSGERKLTWTALPGMETPCP